MKVNRDKGILLDREEGFSIREIAKRNQCSTTTVQKVLKNISVNIPDEDISENKAVEEIYNMAIRKEGVLYSEEYECLRKIFGEGNIEKGIIGRVRRRIRSRAQREGRELLFIPNWLGRERGGEKRDIVMSLANELHVRMCEYIEELVCATGGTYNECKEVLLSLAIPSYSDIPVQTQCERIDYIVRKLETK